MLRGSGLAGLSSSVYSCKVKTGTCQSLIPAANEQNSYQPHRPGPWSPVHGAHSWDISDKRRQLNVKLIQGRRQVAWRTHQQATKCPYSSLISLADRDRPTDSPELLVTSSLLDQCRVAVGSYSAMFFFLGITVPLTLTDYNSTTVSLRPKVTTEH